MKKYSLFIGALAVAAIAGCSKVKNLTNLGVDIPYTDSIAAPTFDTTGGIPFPTGGLPIQFPTLSMPTNYQTYLTQYNTSSDKIVSVNLKDASMDISGPSNANFNFLDSISVYVKATGLPTKLLATKGSIPVGQTHITLNASTDLDLKPYFMKDTMYFETQAVFDSLPPANSTININNTVHMVYNPLN